MQDAWRAYLELALGLTEASKKKAQKVARKLVGQSGATAAQLQGMAEELLSTSLANREALVKIIRFEVDRALGKVGLATAEEVADLNARMSELQRKLREAEERLAEQETAPSRAPTPQPAAAAMAEATAAEAAAAAVAEDSAAGQAVVKRTVAKKTIAKKTVAKKAVAKKTVAKKTAAKEAVAKKAVAGKAAGEQDQPQEPTSTGSASPATETPKRVDARKLPPPPAQKAAKKAAKRAVKKATPERSATDRSADSAETL